MIQNAGGTTRETSAQFPKDQMVLLSIIVRAYQDCCLDFKNDTIGTIGAKKAITSYYLSFDFESFFQAATASLNSDFSINQTTTESAHGAIVSIINSHLTSGTSDFISSDANKLIEGVILERIISTPDTSPIDKLLMTICVLRGELAIRCFFDWFKKQSLRTAYWDSITRVLHCLTIKDAHLMTTPKLAKRLGTDKTRITHLKSRIKTQYPALYEIIFCGATNQSLPLSTTIQSPLFHHSRPTSDRLIELIREFHGSAAAAEAEIFHQDSHLNLSAYGENEAERNLWVLALLDSFATGHPMWVIEQRWGIRDQHAAFQIYCKTLKYYPSISLKMKCPNLINLIPFNEAASLRRRNMKSGRPPTSSPRSSSPTHGGAKTAATPSPPTTTRKSRGSTQPTPDLEFASHKNPDGKLSRGGGSRSRQTMDYSDRIIPSAVIQLIRREKDWPSLTSSIIRIWVRKNFPDLPLGNVESTARFVTGKLVILKGLIDDGRIGDADQLPFICEATGFNLQQLESVIRMIAPPLAVKVGA